jgi:hypothetical protein
VRAYYLNSGYDQTSGCKGGVGYSYERDYGGEEYELEIGHQCNASPQMIAMCCLHDEFLEILRFKDSNCGALSGMVLRKYHNLVAEIEEGVEEHKEKIREGDKNEEL